MPSLLSKMQSFKENFISNIKDVTNYSTLRQNFEDIDSLSNGRLTKSEFCSVIQKFSSEFKDEDIMRFTRISNLIDENNLVKYPDFLLLCFYDSSNDTFNNCIECIKTYVNKECKNDLNNFFSGKNPKNLIELSFKCYFDLKKKRIHELLLNCNGNKIEKYSFIMKVDNLRKYNKIINHNEFYFLNDAVKTKINKYLSVLKKFDFINDKKKNIAKKIIKCLVPSNRKKINILNIS